MKRAFWAALAGVVISVCIALLLPRPRSEKAPSPAPAQGPPSASLSMKEWREVDAEAQAAKEGPPGPDKIARCEAFLKEHPGHPAEADVLRNLIDGLIVTKNIDPVRLASLLERQADIDPAESLERPEYLVQRYYFEYHLPLDSAERLLVKAREVVEADRRALAKESSPISKRDAQGGLQYRESTIKMLEGRIRSSRGDYKGAVEDLLKAESMAAGSWSGLVMQSPDGKNARILPSGQPLADQLNLALAQAYAGLGDRDKALARLERVSDFTPDFFPEIGRGDESLRKRLDAPPPAAKEVRAPPEPAPDFRIKDLEGKEVTLSKLRDHVVLIMFWSTW